MQTDKRKRKRSGDYKIADVMSKEVRQLYFFRVALIQGVSHMDWFVPFRRSCPKLKKSKQQRR